MKIESKQDRYARVTRAYQKRFGELPSNLLSTGSVLPLCLDLMEEAFAGKRGRVTEADLGYISGAGNTQ